MTHIRVQLDGPFPGTLYEEMGGEEAVARVVNEFYSRVHQDPVLSPIFPPDLTETRRKQFAFLSQFFGGPPLFSRRLRPAPSAGPPPALPHHARPGVGVARLDGHRHGRG